MRTTIATLIVGILVAAGPAMAGMLVEYDLGNAKLTYTAATKHLKVDSGSDIQLYLKNGPATLDTAWIIGGSDFDFLLSLTLTDLPGTDNWSGTGTLKFTDTDKTSNAVEANIKTTDIDIKNGIGETLVITGYLTDISGGGILVNRGDPWKYAGEIAIPLEPDKDGVAGQITVTQPSLYDVGKLWVLEFGVGTLSEDTFFGSDQTVTGGNVKGSVVPAPAAVLLGMMGLGIVGVRMRRLA